MGPDILVCIQIHFSNYLNSIYKKMVSQKSWWKCYNKTQKTWIKCKKKKVRITGRVGILKNIVMYRYIVEINVFPFGVPQVHHCGGAWPECVGLPVWLHLLSVWRAQRVRSGHHALQRQGRYLINNLPIRHIYCSIYISLFNIFWGISILFD